ncbi:hypothetical protein CW354_09245 [Marinicaulis flavus]|uniref:Uncharacterized protein n=1 Tax=Hyphococcus luteus TaxID=2058213 RepID=A0A2S7K7H1_9PROT|nr:hypothetical protein CW354_09245 [Marinicaulis flavus]
MKREAHKYWHAKEDSGAELAPFRAVKRILNLPARADAARPPFHAPVPTEQARRLEPAIKARRTSPQPSNPAFADARRAYGQTKALAAQTGPQALDIYL